MDNNISSSILKSNGYVLQIDNNDIYRLIKNNNLVKFHKDDNNMIYTLNEKNKKIYILNLLYDDKIVGYKTIKFKNGDLNNYSKANIDISSSLEYPSGSLIKEYEGLISTSGKFKNIEMNKAYHVKDINDDYIWMHIKDDIWTKIDSNMIDQIRKYKEYNLIWNFNSVKNQIEASYFEDKIKHIIVLHRYIYELHNKITKFNGLRHYNNDILDNRINNLFCNLNEIKKIVKEQKYYSYDKNLLENEINENYDIISFDEGHRSLVGNKANQLLNPIWTVIEKNNINNIFNIIYTSNNKFIKVSLDDIDLIKSNNNKNLTWNINEHGYAYTTSEQIYTYMHRLIMQSIDPNDDPNLSVDHINRDRLDNRRENLKWANQSEQNYNQNKKTRKYNAQELPKEIENIVLPKYVYYAKEIYNKISGATREFFRIENHPKLLAKCWSSSKSSKISILDKLEETKQKLYELDNNILKIDEDKFILPVGIRVADNKKRNNKEMILDLRTEKIRYNLKMVYNDNISLEDNYHIFQDKIISKYPKYLENN